jgi:hypothetical protein
VGLWHHDFAELHEFTLSLTGYIIMYGSPLKHPLSYPNCTPSTLTTRLPALKTRNNHIFGMPAALTALLSTLNYWFRGLKLLAFQLNFSVL